MSKQKDCKCGKCPKSKTYQKISKVNFTLKSKIVESVKVVSMPQPPTPDLGPAPLVAILGAGLSGTMAGYRLTQKGYNVVVFEGRPDRVGGRCWSKHFPTKDGLYSNGQVFEQGGELIDDGHLTTKQLCQELRLDLDNTIATELPGTSRKMFVAKKTYDASTDSVSSEMIEISDVQAKSDFQTLWRNGLKKDYDDVSYPWLAYPPPGIFTDKSNELDQVNISVYLDQFKEIIQNTTGDDLEYFMQLLKVIYNIEWSGEPWEMSTLDLHSLLPTRGPGKFRYWGESNEKYHVRGGNSQIAEIMEVKINEAFGFATPYEGSEMLGVKRGHKILKIDRKNNGNYELTIEVDGISFKKTFERVITTLPPTIYRNDDRVGNGVNNDFSWYTDISLAGISSLKLKAINEIGFGPIGKININFNTRFWNNVGWNGEAVATTKYARYLKNGVMTGDDEAKLINETQFQQCWEVTRGQPGSMGIMTDYYIGDYAKLKYDGLYSTGRVIDGTMDTVNVSNYEASLWTDIQSQKDNLNRFIRQLGECDPTLGQLAEDNLDVDSNGNVTNSYETKNWWLDEFTRGSFVFYKTNQETHANAGFSGIEPFAEPIFTDITETVETEVFDRKLHFSGSMTDYDWNGWMEGALTSGDRVAIEVSSVFMDAGYTQSLIN